MSFNYALAKKWVHFIETIIYYDARKHIFVTWGGDFFFSKTDFVDMFMKLHIN